MRDAVTAIKSLLSEKGMTIKQLAEKTGISVNTLYSITKRGTGNMYGENLGKILEVLEITKADFFQYSSDDDRELTAPVRLSEIDKEAKERKDSVMALWLGIQCIEAYNDDPEESKRAISILTDMIESQ